MDILLENGLVLTMNEKDEILEQGQVLIRDGEIVGVGSDLGVLRRDVNKSIDCSGKIVMPGLCNSHAHLEEIVERGMIANLPLEPWFAYKISLENYLNLSPEEVELVVCHACIEMIKGGVTSVVHHYYGRPSLSLERTKPVVRALDKMGMRAMISPAVSDKKLQDTIPLDINSLPPELRRSLEDTSAPRAEWCVEVSEEIVEYIKSQGGLIGVFLGPSGPQRCSDKLLKELRNLAREHNVGIHTHLLETKVQAMMGHKLYGKSMVEHLEDIGFLFAGLTVAHSIWLTDREIDLLGRYGVNVVHNPASNLKLGDGICPVKKMEKAGVNVALGTDGGNCGDTYSVFDQVRLASLIHNVGSADTQMWLSPREALRMGTRNGGKIISPEDPVGSLEKGRRADIIILRPSQTYVPFNDVVNQMAYTETGNSVDTVLIDGKIVMEGKVITAVDACEIYRQVGKIAERLVKHRGEATQEASLFEPFLMDMYHRVSREFTFRS
jgi:cytosine/adenosine deaminase-related metal-dependent hydrolase